VRDFLQTNEILLKAILLLSIISIIIIIIVIVIPFRFAPSECLQRTSTSTLAPPLLHILPGLLLLHALLRSKHASSSSSSSCTSCCCALA
jgi:hypothetical protein